MSFHTHLWLLCSLPPDLHEQFYNSALFQLSLPHSTNTHPRLPLNWIQLPLLWKQENIVFPYAVILWDYTAICRRLLSDWQQICSMNVLYKYLQRVGLNMAACGRWSPTSYSRSGSSSTMFIFSWVVTWWATKLQSSSDTNWMQILSRMYWKLHNWQIRCLRLLYT